MKVKILGPFNSGTNLLQNLIKKCEVSYVDNIKKKYWKHTIYKKNIPKEFDLFIQMYRHPYLWINSLKKHPII